jgi:hypothetical protein
MKVKKEKERKEVRTEKLDDKMHTDNAPGVTKKRP